ncbi:unnamed protein product [Dibothriocephalus latus]|uniref:Uncharacterized protein n=1 Tax=Dibothriocephalus latus TaxID=60516 RepID=A0A3P7RA06_DIBLA|nr:unnamed protein product [Dibothriocephalus latus]
MEDVVVTPDSSSLAAAASGTMSSSDSTKPEIDDAEVKAIGDKFGM